MPIVSSQYAARVRSATVKFVPRRFVAPLKISSGVIREITEAQVSVEVEIGHSGLRAVGRGTIYLSDLWAWPSATVDHEQRDRALRSICETIAASLPELFGAEFIHPLEMGLRLYDWTCHELQTADKPPVLARAVCCSPFDAAIHDAVGHAVGESAFRFYDEHFDIPSADLYFSNGEACRAIRRVIQSPRNKLPAWFLVASNDDPANMVTRAVKDRGFFCFKIKIGGQDNAIDAQRTIDVFQAARAAGIESPRLSIDSNEANPDAASVLAYLQLLEARDLDAYRALEYVEQPTGRDITENAWKWHEIGEKKPVFLDEGLVDIATLQIALEQGWSGVALKTCKGHSMLLTTAAWAYEHGMLLALQDLTNPGISLIHAALVGAYLPTVNGAELNSPQFTPEANAEFLDRLGPLFEPADGFHALTHSSPLGLGSKL